MISAYLIRFLTQGGALILHGKGRKLSNSLEWFTDKSNLVRSYREHEWGATCCICIYADKYVNPRHNQRPVFPPLPAFQAQNCLPWSQLGKKPLNVFHSTLPSSHTVQHKSHTFAPWRAFRGLFRTTVALWTDGKWRKTDNWCTISLTQ